MLRRVLRFVQNARRLRAHMAKADLAKAAQSYRAFQELLAADDLLRGIHAVEQHRAWLATTGDDIRERAAQLLLRGVDAQHQADTATALQVFLNLGTLQLRVTACYDGVLRRVREAIDRMFELDAAPPPTTCAPRSGNASRRCRTRCTTASCKCIICTAFCCVVAIRRRIVRWPARSPIRRRLPLTVRFWRDAVALLDARVSAATGSSSEVLDAFIVDYARALRQLHEVLRRVRGHFQAKRVRAPLSEADGASLLAIVARFRTPYLQRSWERLYAEAQSAFGVTGGGGGGSEPQPQRVPSAQQILRFRQSDGRRARSVGGGARRGARRRQRRGALGQVLCRRRRGAGRRVGRRASHRWQRAEQRRQAQHGRVCRSVAAAQLEHVGAALVWRRRGDRAAGRLVAGRVSTGRSDCRAPLCQVHQGGRGDDSRHSSRQLCARRPPTERRCAAEQPLECSAFVRALQNHVETFRSHTLARFGTSDCWRSAVSS
jgi:hypothetical protein